MPRVMLIHWNEAEADERATRLRTAGFEPVIFKLTHRKRIGDDPPDAFVIDLSRLPAQGRDVATFLRHRKSTRHIPIVFVDGEPEKVARARQVLPDATFTEWTKIRGAVRDAMKNRPAALVVPNTMAGYSGTPLVKKLGIKERATVALIDSPDGFESTLEPLPDGVQFKQDLRGRTDVVVLFVSRMVDLESQFPRAERSLDEGGKLWIAWPKVASGVKTDITQPGVREFGLAAGWVDYKICAIDQIWSGLAFSRRRKPRARAKK